MRRPIILAPDLRMPLDAVTRTFGIFGQRGTGKSTTGAVLVEQIVRARARAVVFDPTGVWHGLTRAGSEPGLPGVVLGGEREYSDVPLEPTGGALVAEFVIAADAPLTVLDLKLLRKHQRQRFAMDFLEVLYHDSRDPLHVVIDEAAQFAPQQIRKSGGDEDVLSRLLGAVEDVVKLGRSRGLGVTMIEQRLATLNANVREQIETLVAHRLVGPLDRKALKEWVAAQGEPEREAEALAVIPKLDPGTALVWSPSFLKFFGEVAVNNATTYDSRATPEVGKQRKKLGARAPVDLDVLRERMAATIQEHAANDPKKLREKLRETEAKLAAALRRIGEMPTPEQVEEMQGEIRGLTAQLVDVEPETIEVEIISPDTLARLEKILDSTERGHEAVIAAYKDLREVLHPMAYNVKQVGKEQALARGRERVPQGPSPVQQAVAQAIRERAATQAQPTSAVSNGELNTAARHFLETLARRHPARLTVGQLGTLARRKTRGGSFNTAMSQLREGGYVEEASGLLGLSERGVAVTEAVQGQALTPEEIIQDWISKLPSAAADVFKTLVDAYPRTLTVEEVGERTGRRTVGGSWNTAVSMLTKNRLALKSSAGMRASDDLFT